MEWYFLHRSLWVLHLFLFFVLSFFPFQHPISVRFTTLVLNFPDVTSVISDIFFLFSIVRLLNWSFLPTKYFMACLLSFPPPPFSEHLVECNNSLAVLFVPLTIFSKCYFPYFKLFMTFYCQLRECKPLRWFFRSVVLFRLVNLNFYHPLSHSESVFSLSSTQVHCLSNLLSLLICFHTSPPYKKQAWNTFPSSSRIFYPLLTMLLTLLAMYSGDTTLSKWNFCTLNLL